MLTACLTFVDSKQFSGGQVVEMRCRQTETVVHGMREVARTSDLTSTAAPVPAAPKATAAYACLIVPPNEKSHHQFVHRGDSSTARAKPIFDREQ